MDAKTRKKVKNKTINHIGYKGDEDGELIDLAKEYTNLRPGLTVKAAIRNYLLVNLPKAIEQLRGGNVARQGQE